MRFKSGGHYSRHDELSFGPSYDTTEFAPLKVAKSRFRLNDADLQPLRVVKTVNPVDPHYAPMKLYRLADLQVRGGRARSAQRGSAQGSRARRADNCGTRGAASPTRGARGRGTVCCRRAVERCTRMRCTCGPQAPSVL